MNRRDLLIWLGLAACGPRKSPSGGGKRAPRDASPNTDGDSESTTIVDDWGNGNTTQDHQSPLVVRDELVARLTEDELLFVDAPSLKTIDHVSERYASVCLFQKSLLGFARPDKKCEVDIFEGRQLMRTAPLPGSCNTNLGGLIVGAGQSKVFLAQDDRKFVRYQLTNGALTEELAIELEDVPRNYMDQALGLGDGRLLIPAARHFEAYGGSEIARYSAVGPISHLCAGSSDRIWYSVRKGQWADRVVLAKLGSTLTTEATISVAPGRVTHMASAADGSLAVVTSVVPTDLKSWVPSILLFDPKGVEQKRISILDLADGSIGADINAGFVARTPTTVVLDLGRHGLLGWNISTGARIS
ncbi:MAG TPA: hypothetical protein VL326_31315 [Kofleriaceae bacterium]|nr:hypothetical protein [Kofleriaceae bacterium]